MLTSCLTTIKNHVIKYCEKVYERSGKNLFWSIKNSCEVLNKLKSRGFRASSLSTYVFSTLYTTLPHNLIKDKLVDLIDRTFQREGSLYIACNDRNAFFTSDAVRNYNLWSCQKVCEALTFLLDNIYIRFGSKLYRQVVGIPMGTNCAPLVADLFLFCYERDFMLSLSEDNQSGVIEAFNSTSRYLDDLLNIDNNFFDSMVNRIYPSELQLNKDWQKQQQRERQMNNKPSSPNKTPANTKDKPQKKQTNKPNTSNREQKGSKNELSLQNKFDALSDESEMEYVDSLDHSRNSDKVSWSPILPPSP